MTRPLLYVWGSWGVGVNWTHWAWFANSGLRRIWVSSWAILFFISSKYWPAPSRLPTSCAKLPAGFQRQDEKVNNRVLLHLITLELKRIVRTLCQSKDDDGYNEGEFHGCWAEKTCKNKRNESAWLMLIWPDVSMLYAPFSIFERNS